MPENTVKVDRSTKWGNPFVAGRDGTVTQCVSLYRQLVIDGMVCWSCDAPLRQQIEALQHVRSHISALRGRNLACWCALDMPCHAAVLIEIANAPLAGHPAAPLIEEARRARSFLESGSGAPLDDDISVLRARG